MEQTQVPLKVEINHVLDEGQTKQIQSHVVKHTLAAIDEALRQAGHKELMNKKEAAAFIGVSLETLERMISDGLPVHQHYERTYLFLKSEILEFIIAKN